MPKTLRSRLSLVSIGIGFFLLGGCGQRTVTVSGTALFPDGVKLESTDSVQIIFAPDDKAKAAPLALFSQEDKSFVCKDVLPGTKYKISLRIEPRMGAPDAQKRAASFEALNKAFDRTNTKLTYQATDDSSQSVAIDLVKGTVTSAKK
jgi:hypothetical protein